MDEQFERLIKNRAAITAIKHYLSPRPRHPDRHRKEALANIVRLADREDLECADELRSGLGLDRDPLEVARYIRRGWKSYQILRGSGVSPEINVYELAEKISLAFSPLAEPLDVRWDFTRYVQEVQQDNVSAVKLIERDRWETALAALEFKLMMTLAKLGEGEPCAALSLREPVLTFAEQRVIYGEAAPKNYNDAKLDHSEIKIQEVSSLEAALESKEPCVLVIDGQQICYMRQSGDVLVNFVWLLSLEASGVLSPSTISAMERLAGALSLDLGEARGLADGVEADFELLIDII